MNDIQSCIGNSQIHCFANGTKIIKGIKNVDDADDLQKDLNSRHSWAVVNKMEFND